MTKAQIRQECINLMDEAERHNEEYNANKGRCFAESMLRVMKGEKAVEGTDLGNFIQNAELEAKKTLADAVLALMPKAESLLKEAKATKGCEEEVAAMTDFLSLRETINESGIR